MRTDIDQLWYELHMASGQVPMVRIRNTFRAIGMELAHGRADATWAWEYAKEAFLKSNPGTKEQADWRAFVGAARAAGYGPAWTDPEAQERQEKDLSVQKDAPGAAEARSRMATRGTRVRWQSVNTGGVVTPPKYPGDVGMDLAASADTVIYPGQVTYVPTGVAFAAPPGYWILLVGRSSLAAKHGLAMVPGVIDNGYRGEMLAGLYPISPGKSAVIHRGTRVAQAILMPSVEPVPERVDWLPESDRGHNGFGSTGGHTPRKERE